MASDFSPPPGQLLPLPKSRTAAQLYTLSQSLGSNAMSGQLLGSELEDQIVINFPNLPDEIALSRDTEYKQVTSQFLPDGFHIYQHTTPLQIPLSFHVHAYDDYAISGPETILQIAAQLHALTLPIIASSNRFRLTSSDEQSNGTTTSTEAKKNNPTPIRTSSSNSAGVQPGKNNKVYFPPACVLNLMVGSGGASGLGIICVGYVKSVDVRLRGPYLSSSDPSVNRNLPSAADFNFVFVHAPTYTNSFDAFSGGDLDFPQLGANRARYSLYNTIDLIGELKSIGYKGLYAADS